jgi:hypothetical protein
MVNDSFPVIFKTEKVKEIKMKKLLTSLLILGSTVAMAACSGNGVSEHDLDGTINSGPYAEERTVGATQAAPVVRSAAPVFERRQVK